MSHSQKKSEPRALIVKVREGDQEAFASLLSLYTPLIESIISKFSVDEILSFQRDDLRQEATLVFYNSILTYDLDQTEVEFGLYAKICISNSLISYLRVLKKDAQRALTDSQSETLFIRDYEDPGARILEQEKLKALYSIIRNNLSDFEYRVWQMYMSGRTTAEIAAKVNKDEKSVSNAIYRIRKKLRALLQ